MGPPLPLNYRSIDRSMPRPIRGPSSIQPRAHACQLTTSAWSRSTARWRRTPSSDAEAASIAAAAALVVAVVLLRGRRKRGLGEWMVMMLFTHTKRPICELTSLTKDQENVPFDRWRSAFPFPTHIACTRPSGNEQTNEQPRPALKTPPDGPLDSSSVSTRSDKCVEKTEADE